MPAPAVRHCPWWVPGLVLAATVAQLAVAAFVPGIDRFDGKAFGARLVAYPLLMLLVPALWWLRTRRTAPAGPVPWGAFALVMLPFLVDVTGNSLDLYDAVVWWDDLNHFANWAMLCGGLGLLLARRLSPAWVLVVAVTGLGAVLAIGWEVGEWVTFIRNGTELDTAYQDTLGDEVLGTLGALTAALVLALTRARRGPLPQAPLTPRGRARPRAGRAAAQMSLASDSSSMSSSSS